MEFDRFFRAICGLAIHARLRATAASRALIRNGKAPIWQRLVDGQWQEIPERLAAVREGLRLYLMGYGATKIIERLTELGLSLTGCGPQSRQIFRLVKQRALIGEKEIALGTDRY